MTAFDQQEFEEFARARTPPLLRSAWLLCGDHQQAEDLVQETLAKLYVRWHRRLAPPIDNPAAYAQTTLVRTFLSARRKRADLPTADLPERPVADQVGRSDVRLELGAALAGLTPLDRAVLVLRYLDDLSVAEVADRLGQTQGAIRNRSMRALDRLRPLLDVSVLEGQP